VHQQLYETTRDAGLNDSLDLVVGTIAEVGNGPAGIDQNLVVQGVNKLGKNRQSRSNLSKMRSVKNSHKEARYHIRIDIPCSSQAGESCPGRSCSESK
jgi:hypothetical protein